MQQWYACPKCGADLLYGTEPCPNCKVSLAWSQQGPLVSQAITPITIDDIISRVRSGVSHCILEGIKSPIILRPPEELRIAIPGFNFIEPSSVRNTNAFYGGPSIYIAKGLNFRLGAASAKSQSHDELKIVDTGIFTLTTQRIIFSWQWLIWMIEGATQTK